MAAQPRRPRPTKRVTDNGGGYPAETWAEVTSRVDIPLRNAKQQAERQSANLRAGPVTSSVLFNIYGGAVDTSALITRAKEYSDAHPDFLPYMNETKGVANSEQLLQTTKAAADNVAQWVRDNFPADANGWLLSSTLGARGPEDRTFAPAVTDGLADLLDLFAGTISTTDL